jgi:1,4-alpha-glucan branching enzyme
MDDWAAREQYGPKRRDRIMKRSARGGQRKQAAKQVKMRGGLKMKRVTFQLNADAGSQVCVAGTFNKWSATAHKLKHNGKGGYSLSMLLPPGRHEYKFLVNGQWQLDPNCARQVGNAFGSRNCVLEIT